MTVAMTVTAKMEVIDDTPDVRVFPYDSTFSLSFRGKEKQGKESSKRKHKGKREESWKEKRRVCMPFVSLLSLLCVSLFAHSRVI